MYKTFAECSKRSAYPSLDKVVLNQIGSSGYIRKVITYGNWSSTNKPMLVYEIGGYSFCENINRSHKNNHVFFVADIIRNCVYKKCHDPDCSGYRGYDILA